MIVDGGFSPHIEFSREEWARLRGNTPLTLSHDDLDALHSADEHVSMDEVMEVYLPLSRLLNLYVAATHQLFRVTDTFLGSPAAKVPYVIAIAGSVAGGKSTTSRILQALLARWPDHPKVDLVTTDGFLFPNAVLEERGIMHRKGFPESYDLRRLVGFLAELKSGADEVRAPVYSHLVYDIIPGEEMVVRRPDILILEGLNVLQSGAGTGDRPPRVFVSDFFDFSIYIDASEADLETWYLQRFERLRETAFRDPSSFFHQYAVGMSEPEAMEFGHQVWATINAVNLRENIEPTRERARLILEKGKDHRIERVWLRKL
ncbi:type I pantothenate kinase [Longimicrobium sp.]|uniref:type I pantothenate kinase n=1 Tax=Longimicrobium sp. TaxID=2029185 RepID=UPI002C7107B9|nr:type I pantothenate kinase [Longimicrobium sp.]HSU15941.1 type I pantothenate kinase [Longimicrobium sp.]